MNIRTLLVTGSTLLLAAATVWRSSSTAGSPPISPEEVVAMINGQVSPRFQQDAGRFGMEREVNSFEGHPEADFGEMLDFETAPDRKVFISVAKASYFVILGAIHVRHKPGKFIGSLDMSGQPDNSPADLQLYISQENERFGNRFLPSSIPISRYPLVDWTCTS